jgi:outer membrane protein assembly factor BamA
LENTEDNSEMICKIRKKDKLNSEMIWKIQKKIVKLYGNYGRKTSRIDKRFEKYRRQL